MRRLSINIILILFFACCKHKNPEIQSEGENANMESIVVENKQEITEFENTILAINTIELPDTIFCGIDFSVPVKEYGNEVVQIAPKPSEETRIYGRLPSKGGKVYVIYAIPGDINYPYLYTYNKDGQLIDSFYLHIGPCLGDESIVISNVTVINKDYSIHMVDTSKYVHYNEENKRFIDSVFVTKRDLALNFEHSYQVVNEKRYKINQD